MLNQNVSAGNGVLVVVAIDRSVSAHSIHVRMEPRLQSSEKITCKRSVTNETESCTSRWKNKSLRAVDQSSLVCNAWK